MKNTSYKAISLVGAMVVLLFFGYAAHAQYKAFVLSPKGDTLNIVDKKNLKQGRWVITVQELRGEPGYEEEGYFKDDKKWGPWRKYNSTGDILAIENYKAGGKEGVQEYFTFLGDLIRHEEWKGYDPNSPYDTIGVYGEGNNQITSYKLVKAEQYSVPNGVWKYYAPGDKFIKAETYDHGRLLKQDGAPVFTATKKVSSDDASPEKTQEMLDYEKKYSKKKRKAMERDGQTGL